MFFWYIGLSVAAVHAVFRSRGLDYRLVAFGALLPLLVDAPFGRAEYAHTLAASVGLLAVVMVGTVGRPRLRRRRLLCLPIGSMCGLVLSGAFASPQLFWWPALGSAFPPMALVPPATLLVLAEAAGLAVCAWLVPLFGLSDPARRAAFLRTGRLTRV